MEQIAATYLGSKINQGVNNIEGLNGSAKIAISSTANTLMESTLGLGLQHTPIDAEALAANAIGSTIGNEVTARMPHAAKENVQEAHQTAQRSNPGMQNKPSTQHHSANPDMRKRPGSATPAYDANSDAEIIAADAAAHMQLAPTDLSDLRAYGPAQAAYNSSAAQRQNWKVDHSFGAGLTKAKQEVISKQSRLIFGAPLPNNMTELQAANSILSSFVEGLKGQPLNPIVVIKERYNTVKSFINTMYNGTPEEKGYALGMSFYEGTKAALLNAETGINVSSLALGKAGFFAASAKLAGAGKVIGMIGMTGKGIRNSSAVERLQLEKLKTEYRQKASWVNPSEIKNPKLFNIVDDLYRANAKVGSGSTADAARIEISDPAIKVGGKMHIEKVDKYISALEKIIVNDKLTSHELAIAENIRLDLLDSIGNKLWYSQTNTPKY